MIDQACETFHLMREQHDTWQELAVAPAAQVKSLIPH